MVASVVGAASTSGEAVTLTCAKPTGTAQGDVMIVFHTDDYHTLADMTAPAGWTLVTSVDNGTNNVHAKVWTKTAGASEPSSYGFGNASSGTDGCVSIVTLRGVTETAPIFATAVSGTSTTQVCPSLAGVPAGSVLLCMAMIESNNHPNTYTAPSGMVKQTDVQSTAWNAHSVASLLNAPATTPAETFTASTVGVNAEGGIEASIAFAPSGGGAPAYSGSGTAALTLAATGSGSKATTGTGSGSVGLTASGSGVKHAIGTGSASLTLAATSTGVAHRSGTGTASVALTATASGTASRSGTGTASITLTATGGASILARDITLSAGLNLGWATMPPAPNPITAASPTGSPLTAAPAALGEFSAGPCYI